VLLLGVGAYVLVEAVMRVRHPEEVQGWEMFAVAAVGLGVNVVAVRLLREGSRESINVQGAYLEVLADLLSSVGVLVAAAIVGLTGWTYADPIIAAGIGLFIFPRTWRLGGQALRVLVQAAPAGLDVDEMRSALAVLPGVVDVHDLHVWTLTSEMDVATAHLMIGDDVDAHGVLDGARQLLVERFGVHHATLQVEPESHQGCDELNW
jgi:cobalt-zinc-cadmium efflux system protein